MNEFEQAGKTSYPLEKEVQALALQRTFFKIKRHIRSGLSDDEANTILAEGVKLLRERDDDDDFPCAVDIVKEGAVETFNVTDGVVDSDEALAAVCGVAGRVLVINTIRHCPGGSMGMGVIKGCACASGRNFMVIRADAAQEPALWMHEYGHNRGLPHVDAPGNLMHYELRAANRSVTQSQCLTIQGNREAPPVMGPEILVEDAVDVLTFLSRTYIHGVPYELAERYGAEAVPTLLNVLADRAQQKQWDNAVAVLASIGDARAVDPLIAFIRQGDGLLAREEYEAKVTAIVGLGAILHKQFDASALEFLVGAFQPDGWPEHLPWRNPYGLSPDEQGLHLRTMCVWGLAYSGIAPAREALSALIETGIPFLPEWAQATLIRLLSESLAYYARIAEIGLKQYFAEGGRL